MKITKIEATISGIAGIMFDKFIDHSKESRPAEQKLYLTDKNQVVLPTENLIAFLFGDNPMGCARALEGKRGKEYLRVGQSHVFFDGDYLSFKRNGKPIKFNGFDDKSMSIYKSAPRTLQGSRSIKQEIKDRPLLHTPWELTIKIGVAENNLIDETKLFNWFTVGGILISLGTYRPRFGRFTIKEWNVV